MVALPILAPIVDRRCSAALARSLSVFQHFDRKTTERTTGTRLDGSQVTYRPVRVGHLLQYDKARPVFTLDHQAKPRHSRAVIDVLTPVQRQCRVLDDGPIQGRHLAELMKIDHRRSVVLSGRFRRGGVFTGGLARGFRLLPRGRLPNTAARTFSSLLRTVGLLFGRSASSHHNHQSS